MFHLRRSQFLQVFNNSPDETAYYRYVPSAVWKLEPVDITCTFQAHPPLGRRLREYVDDPAGSLLVLLQRPAGAGPARHVVDPAGPYPPHGRLLPRAHLPWTGTTTTFFKMP